MNELKNPVEVRPRGRPAKNSPLVYEGIVVMPGDDHERSLELVKNIQATGEKISALMINTAQMYFELGAILFQTLQRIPGQRGVTTQIMNQITGVPARMVCTALKVYKHFDHNPELLENLSMRDVVLLISDKPQNSQQEKPHVEYGIPKDQLEFPDLSATFAIPSSCGLERYRVRNTGGRFYVFCKDINSAIPACNLTVAEPRNETMQQAYDKLNIAVQNAIEAYYSAVEQSENE